MPKHRAPFVSDDPDPLTEELNFGLSPSRDFGGPDTQADHALTWERLLS